MAILVQNGGIVKVIPVRLQPEPPDFDRDVRQKGCAWLGKKKIPLNSPPPNPEKLPSYWRQYNECLWKSYNGVCAYLAFFFEFSTGSSSTDHFVAKSRLAGAAYEWDNFRLACFGANRSKNNYDDILDPFSLPENTFFLDLDTGAIHVNPKLNKKLTAQAKETIDRLDLDHQKYREMRVRHVTIYVQLKSSSSGDAPARYLQELNPFVYHEMKRQGKL